MYFPAAQGLHDAVAPAHEQKIQVYHCECWSSGMSWQCARLVCICVDGVRLAVVVNSNATPRDDLWERPPFVVWDDIPELMVEYIIPEYVYLTRSHIN